MRQPEKRRKIRSPAVAGTFYPAEADSLNAWVRRFLDDAESVTGTLRALIAPHAGFIYSGPVAGTAFQGLRRQKHSIRRVVLLGPSHYFPLHGAAVSSASAFETPLGLVPVDQDAQEMLMSLPHVCISDEVHAPEHSLETHLPFLQVALDTFSIVPLVIGDATPEEVHTWIEPFAEQPDTLIAVSSDLSHFYDYETARRLDAATAHAIEQLQPTAIGREHACGRIPIQGLLHFATHHHLTAKTLDMRNSGDTAGSRDRVVGYGAYGFYE